MKTLRKLLVITFIFMLCVQTVHAASATWSLNPGSGDWNTATNWTPATVPNGPTDTATFATSKTTGVALSGNTEVSDIVFNSDASAFTITASPPFQLTISGAGIMNNSGRFQNFGTALGATQIVFHNSATAGSLTAFTNNPGTPGVNETHVTFKGTSTAGNGTFTNNGGTVSGAVGGATGFDNNSKAGNGTFTNSGGTVSGAFGGITGFDDQSTADNGTFRNNGGTVSGAFGGITVFCGNTAVGNGTFTNNGGTVSGANGGVTYFGGNSTGDTARVEVFGSGRLDISGHNAPDVTTGSIEGSGAVFLGARNLTVGSNNRSTTFSGVIQDGAPNDGEPPWCGTGIALDPSDLIWDGGPQGATGGSLTKIGSGTLTLSGTNTYTGGTSVNAGILEVSHDGGLGMGAVSVTTSGATLRLQTGATNNYIADAATLSIASGSTVDLNFSGTSSDTVLALFVNGVVQPAGVYGSAASGAPHQLPEFSGTGTILVTTAAPSPTPIPDCAWTTAAVLPGPGVENMAVTSVGSYLYTFGGDSDAGTLDTARSFDGTNWTTIAPLPVPLGGAAAVTDGTNIYIVGGSTSAPAVQNTLTRYNIGTNTYTVLTPFSIATFYPAAVYLNGKIYKFTGLTGGGFAPTDALEIYDIANNSWSAGANYPLSLSGVGVFVQGGFIYGAGGFDCAGSFRNVAGACSGSVKTFRYDPVLNIWNDAVIVDLPESRVAPASGFYIGEGVLAGGAVAGTTMADASNTVISWNPVSNTWSTLPNMLQTRVAMNGAVLGGSFYVVGGDTPTGEHSNDNQKLTCTLATPTPTPTPATLGNISTRLQVGTGANVMIAGFIVQGSAPKRVLIRAAGPSLTQFGVPNALANPQITLNDSMSTIGRNDDWQTTQIGGVITGDQVAEIQNSGLAPGDPAESAIIATLLPGSYTAIVQGVNAGTGVGIVEVYDLDATSGSFLANISTRGFVQTGDNAMIGGFIVVTQPTRVIIRAIGPSLTQFGVPDALANPQLELHDASSLIGQNNDWQTTQIGGIIGGDQVAEIQNSGLAPTDSAESAIIATLQPGSYTAIVSGVNNTTGNALVEVYRLP